MVGQLEREVGAFTGEIEEPFDRHLSKSECLGALSANVLRGERLIAKLLENSRLQILVRLGGVEQVTGQHGVEGEPRKGHAVTGEDHEVRFQVMADFLDRGAFEDRAENVECGLAIATIRRRILRARAARRACRGAVENTRPTS